MATAAAAAPAPGGCPRRPSRIPPHCWAAPSSPSSQFSAPSPPPPPPLLPLLPPVARPQPLPPAAPSPSPVESQPSLAAAEPAPPHAPPSFNCLSPPPPSVLVATITEATPLDATYTIRPVLPPQRRRRLTTAPHALPRRGQQRPHYHLHEKLRLRLSPVASDVGPQAGPRIDFR